MNKVLLTGRLTRDPEMRSLASGKNVTTFTVASNEFIGGGREKAEYHPVVTWDRLAEIAGTYLGKGQQVAIEGRLQTRSWDDDRGARYCQVCPTRPSCTLALAHGPPVFELHPTRRERKLGPMEPSEEIRRVIERWTMAIAVSDDDSALGRLSEHPGTLMIGMIGPDPTKLWKGSETRAIWARQLVEIGPFPVMATEIQAWEEGTVGWAGVKETIN